ncbi:MAG: hypothetical protein WC455_28795 [Dehalococcoidia bacterium]|jgi:hypothetical protein
MPRKMLRTHIEIEDEKSQMNKSDLRRRLEDYAGQLSPEHIGAMAWGRVGLLTARVLTLLVELELKRLN